MPSAASAPAFAQSEPPGVGPVYLAAIAEAEAETQTDPGEVYGFSEPRICTPPRRELTPETTLGFECVGFARRVLGMTLYPWQVAFLLRALELNEDGRFRFKEVHLLVARQQGKTAVAKVLILWRLFIDGAEMVLGGAQSRGDAEDVWWEVLDQAEDVPSLRRRMLPAIKSTGKHALRIRGKDRSIIGQYKVVTLKADAGRGKTADLLFLDELREHKSWEAWNALSSTTLVPRKGQIVTASNAGEAKSVVLRAKRQSAIDAITRGDTDGELVGLMEWSAPDDSGLDDIDGLRHANPSVGYGPQVADVLAHRSKTEAGYRTENLCQWVDVLQAGVVPMPKWRACRDVSSKPEAEAAVYTAVDVSWDRGKAHIAVAARRPDGRWHVEVVASRAGTEWVVPWLTRRRASDSAPTVGDECWFDGRVVVQARGAPASSLIESMTEAGFDVVDWSGPELAKSSGVMFDLIIRGAIRHRGQPVLDEAAKTVRAKTAGDAWYFDRKHSPTDAAPLIACTAAVWLAHRPDETPGKSIYETEDVLVL